MDSRPASGRPGAAPARRRRRVRASVAFWVTVSVVLVGVAATSGPGGASPDLDFRQVGHWVYSSTLGKVFHVNGASKSVDAAGDVEGGLAGGPAVQGPGSVYVPAEDGSTIEFGKSRLRVRSKLPTGVNEMPVGLQVPGGPYYVYRKSGVIQRLSPLVTVRLNGNLADPVATPDGTVWVLRETDGALCSLARTATEVSCPARRPDGHRGALTVLGTRPAFVDTTSSEIALIGPTGLGAAMPLGTQVGEDAKVAPAAAQGTLPIVRPRDGSLLLVDTTRLSPGRTPPAPTTVTLGSPVVGTPVTAGRSVAIVDQRDKLVTYDLDGRPVAATDLPVGADVRLSRAEDGRVYVDVEGSENTAIVVDEGGRIVQVPLTDPVPGGDPSRPASPTPPPQGPAAPPTATPTPTGQPPAPQPPATSTPTREPDPAEPPDPTELPDPTTETPPRPGPPDPTARPEPTGTAQPTRTGAPTRTAQPPGPVVPAPTVSSSSRPPGGGPPQAGVPGAPRSVRAAVEGTGATLAWAPGPANGAAVTAYLVSWRTEAEGTVVRTVTEPGTARQSAVTGLTAGVAYVATVAAENRAGRGAAAESNPVTPVPTGPGAPADVAAAADGTDGSVTVTFAAVPGATAYQVTAGNDATLRTATTDATFPSLPVGGRFTFTVAAVDAQGRTGPASAPSNAAVPYRPAGAPTGLRATRGDASVALAWAAPPLNGGELAGYEVAAAGVPARTVSGRTATVGGLTPGRAYAFTVRAVTREQGGDTGATVPGAVSAPAAVTAAALPRVDVVSAALSGGTLTVVVDVDDGAATMTGCTVRVGTREHPGLTCAAGRRTLTVDSGPVTGAPTVTAVGTNEIGTGQPGRGRPLTGGGGACEHPADVLSLGGWSLGLPTGEVVTDLGSYVSDPWFVATADCTGVRFRAAVDGETTANSLYPRSALRDTRTFSSTSGTHTLTVRAAVTRQPDGTPAVVVAQVHGSDDDLATFRLEGGTLYLTEGDDTHAHVVATGVGLGTPFEARFVVGDGSIEAYYNGEAAGTIPGDFSGAYFQAGAFTQANCDNSSPCSASNYGEVVIRGLSVSHTG